MIPMDLSPIGTCAAIGAARGFHVFPCHSPRHGRCSCGRNCGKQAGKHPRTQHGLEDATLDMEQIRSWWLRWPDANIGVSCGPSGLYVVDTDGVAAHDAWLLAAGDHVNDLDTCTKVQTSRGWHYWFTVPADSTLGNTASLIAPGIDTRGKGGYVFLPPSKHISGHTYRFETPLPTRPMPEWLAALVRKPEPVRRDPGTTTRISAPRVPAPAGRLSKYAYAALAAEITILVNIGQGQRNHQLNRSAFNLGQLVAAGLLPEQEVRDALLDAADANGLVSEDGTKACLATIESGLTDGLAHPRQVSA